MWCFNLVLNSSDTNFTDLFMIVVILGWLGSRTWVIKENIDIWKIGYIWMMKVVVIWWMGDILMIYCCFGRENFGDVLINIYFYDFRYWFEFGWFNSSSCWGRSNWCWFKFILTYYKSPIKFSLDVDFFFFFIKDLFSKISYLGSG